MRIAAGLLIALTIAGCAGGDDEGPAVGAGRITCTPTMLRIDTPRVKARPDGVHLDVRVLNLRGISASIDGRPVRGKVVMQLSPGAVPVRCHDGKGNWMQAAFEVVPS